MRLLTTLRVRLLRRFVRRFVRRLVRDFYSHRFNRLYRSRDVGVSHLPGLLVGYDRTVSQPSRRNVCRELVRQVGRSAPPQVLKQLGPRFQASSLDVFLKGRALIPVRVAVLGDGVLNFRFSSPRGFIQGSSQLRENRDHPRTFSRVVLGFGAAREHRPGNPGNRELFLGTRWFP